MTIADTETPRAPLNLPRQFRAMPCEVRKLTVDEGGEQLYEMSISSEREVRRWFGFEILEHSKKAIDATYLDAGMSVRDGHYGDVVGRVRDWKLDTKDKRIRVKFAFSENARAVEIQRDVDRDPPIRGFVSIGYDPQKAVLAEENKNGPSKYQVVRWMPIHVGFVPDAADPDVGPGRDAEVQGSRALPFEVIDDGNAAVPEERTMSTSAVPTVTAPAANPTPTPPAAARTVEVGPPNDYDAQMRAIGELAESHGIQLARVNDWYKRKLTVDQVREELLASMRTTPVAQPASETLDGLSTKDRRRYSYGRALRLEVLRKEGHGKFDGLEAEVHQHLERTSPVVFQRNGGILLPLRVNREDDREGWVGEQRAMGVNVPGGGAELVEATQGELVDFLRKKTIVSSMGAQMITGITQPITFPRQLNDVTMSWVAEGAAPPSSDLKFGVLQITPKSLRGFGKIPRELIMQASIDMEARFKTSLGNAGSLAIDLASLHGAGAASEPLGIYNMKVNSTVPGVIEKSFAALPDRAGLLDMEVKVANENALFGNLGWLTTFDFAGKMAGTPQVPNFPIWMWEGNLFEGNMANFRARGSNQLRRNMGAGANENGLIFGNWGAWLIAIFGNSIEFVVDTGSLAEFGLVKIVCYMYADCGALWPAAFARAKGAGMILP